MLTLLDTVIDSRLEATRVLLTNGLRFEATGISASAYNHLITKIHFMSFNEKY